MFIGACKEVAFCYPKALQMQGPRYTFLISCFFKMLLKSAEGNIYPQHPLKNVFKDRVVLFEYYTGYFRIWHLPLVYAQILF